MLVIPAIDLIDGKCVRLYRGDFGKQTTYESHPVEQALEFQAAGLARLHVVDLEGARSGSGHNREVIGSIVAKVDMPVQVGGGIRSRQDVTELVGAGVEYLILGTSVLTDPERVSKWVQEWGNSRFIVSLDLRGRELQSQGWLQHSEVGLEEALNRIDAWGITQVICTDVEQDGTLEQPNYASYENLSAQMGSQVTLLAAGGVSRPQHISKLKAVGVKGVVIGRALYEGRIALEELADVG